MKLSLQTNKLNISKNVTPEITNAFIRTLRILLLIRIIYLEANKPNTAFVLKEIVVENEKVQCILRLKTSSDPDDYKNSVITFLRIDQKKWAKYLRNKKILYNRMQKW